MSINRSSPVSLYIQLAETLRKRIIHAGLRVGGHLPPVRDLITEYGVSLPVVRQALDLLQRDGVLVVEQGRRTSIKRLPVLAPVGGAQAVLFLSLGRSRTDPFFAHVLAGFEEAATLAGVAVLFTQCSSDTAQALALVRSRAASGVALTGNVPADLVAELRLSGIPLVCAGVPLQSEAPTDVAWAANDDAAGAYQAVQHLLALGHRRIGCVTGDPTAHYWGQRLHGYRQALRDAGIAPETTLHAIASADDSEHGAVAFSTLLALPKPPTAIFAGNDRLARGGYRVARERQVRIPADLAIVGFDDLEFANELEPRLTTIHAECELLGATAFTLLAEVTAGGLPRQVTLPIRLVMRESVAPRR